MRTILCTVGTSISGGTKDSPSLVRYFRETTAWDEKTPELDAEIQARLKNPRYDLTTPAGRIAASAELNSLQRLGVLADDEIILLATDTAEGRACTQALASAIETAFGLPSSQCRIEPVRDLQVRDAARLRGSGLPNLCRKLLFYLRDPSRQYGGGVIVNPTGGYKGIVPFTTILGMLYGARAVYVFESSPTLINLPPLPVVFDLDLFESARPALIDAKNAGVLSPERFLGQIPGLEASQRERYLGFLEVLSDSEACLSPLAEVLLEEEELGSGRVFLSPDCLKKLDDNPTNRSHVLRLLARSGSASWRSANAHPFKTTDLRVFGNSRFNFRVAGFLQGPDFFVCEFFHSDHNLYERRLEGSKRRDYPDSEAFVPLPLAPEKISENTDVPETWAELHNQVSILTEQLHAAKDTIASLNERIERERSENRKLSAKLAEASRPPVRASTSSTPLVDGIPAAARPVEPFSCEAVLAKTRPKSFLYSATHNGSSISVAVVKIPGTSPPTSAILAIKGISGQEYWATFADSQTQ